MNSQRKASLKVWAAFLIVFALGATTGASINSVIRSRTISGSNGNSPISMKDTEAYFETLKRELELSEDQASRMHYILDRTRDDYRAVCADVRPRYDSVRERARLEMRALLIGEQQQRFDSIVTAEDCRCPEPRK